jgi:small subunit ribosomal protein S20
MPRRRQSLKARRKDKKRHAHNLQIKTAIKKKLKELKEYLSAKNIDTSASLSVNGERSRTIEEAKKALKDVISQLAKAAKKDIIHKNTARRKISRLSKKLTLLAKV